MNSFYVADDVKFFGSSEKTVQFVSPFLCAMHSGSLACMQVILDKRSELGLPLDMPFVGDPEGVHAKKFSNLVALLSWSVRPDVAAKALAAVAEKEPKAMALASWAMISNAESNPNLFHAFAQMGAFHGDSDSLRLSALRASLKFCPDAVPELLARLDWDKTLPMFDRPFLFFRDCINASGSAGQTKDDNESSLLKLIEKAKTDGKLGAVLQTFVSYDPKREKNTQIPVTEFSEMGYVNVLMAFLDHVFDPKSRPANVDSSLLDMAEKEGHPSAGAMRSHLARQRAHQALDELRHCPFQQPS